MTTHARSAATSSPRQARATLQQIQTQARGASDASADDGALTTEGSSDKLYALIQAKLGYGQDALRARAGAAPRADRVARSPRTPRDPPEGSVRS